MATGSLDFPSCFGDPGFAFQGQDAALRTGCCSLMSFGLASTEHQNQKPRARASLLLTLQQISVLVLRLEFIGPGD